MIGKFSVSGSFISRSFLYSFGSLRVSLGLHQRVAVELENFAIPVALRMRFQETFEYLRGRVPLVSENVSEAQKIAKPFYLGLQLGICGLAEPGYQLREKRNGRIILLSSHHEARLLLKLRGRHLFELRGWRLLLSIRIAPARKNENPTASAHATPQQVAVRLPTDDANAPINRRFFKSLGKKKGVLSRSKPIETILVFVQQERAAWRLSPANQARRGGEHEN